MIAKLSGRLDSIGETFIVVDVGGVGYRLHCSKRALSEMPPPGTAVVFQVETQLREDSLALYGFLDEAERDWFRLLQSVQGVGARVALGILAVLPPAALAQAVIGEDRAAIGQASGVGPKLAQRIVTELKDKAARLGAAAAPRPAAGGPALPAAASADAVSALVHLGYRASDAQIAIALAARALGAQAPLEALIREGLKGLSQ